MADIVWNSVEWNGLCINLFFRYKKAPAYHSRKTQREVPSMLPAQSVYICVYTLSQSFYLCIYTFSTLPRVHYPITCAEIHSV